MPNDVLETVTIGNIDTNSDYVTYFSNLKDKYVSLIKGKRNVKVSLLYDVYKSREGDRSSRIPLRSGTEKVINNTDNVFTKMIHKVIEKLKSYINNCSEWSVNRNGSLKVNVAKYTPIAGGSQVKLPNAQHE